MPDNKEMFKLTVEFSTDNAVFEDSRESEIDRILNDIIYAVYNYDEYGKVLDSNGNTIGRWFLGDDPEL